MLFSLLFNVLAIPISAGAIYPATGSRLPPEVAALAMALSSVSVVTSSLLLNRYRPPALLVEDMVEDKVEDMVEERAVASREGGAPGGELTGSGSGSGSGRGSGSFEMAALPLVKFEGEGLLTPVEVAV